MRFVPVFAALTATISILAASPAFATCADGFGLTVTSISNPTTSYDPVSGSASSASSKVTIQNATGATCNVQVTWTRTGSSWAPTDGSTTLTTPSLSRIFNGGAPALGSMGSATNTVVGNIPNGSSATFELVANISAGQYVNPLLFSRGITLTFAARAVPSGVLPYNPFGGSAAGDFSVSVQKAVNFNFVGTVTTFGGVGANKNYTVDFGSMTTGEASNIFIQFRGNASVSTAFASANNGVLKHSNPLVTTTVPYTLVVDGTTLPNATGTPPTMLANTGSSGVATYPIGITLGSVSGKIAGSYSDTITVTITPQ